MFSHEEMVSLQAEKHELVNIHSFGTQEEYVLYLIHKVAYEQAARFAEGKVVLDLGCNLGYGSNIIKRVCKSAVGVDVSSKAVSTANNLFGRNGIDFQVIDGKRLPFEDDEFDLIVSFQVIEHIVDYREYIGEIKRVLSPGGKVLFTTPNGLLRLDPGMKPWNPFHVREFDPSEFEKLLSEYFKDVAVYGLFAEEPLYSIEVARVKRALEKVRRKNKVSKSFYGSLRTMVKTFLPEMVLKEVARLETALQNAGYPGKRLEKSTEEFQKQHTTAKLFYKNSDLENALDLFGVCGTNLGGSFPDSIIQKNNH